MSRSLRRNSLVGILSLLVMLVIGVVTAPPSQAHWADLAAAEILVNPAAARMTLTFPTGLVPFADSDQNGQLSRDEINAHTAELQAFFAEKIQFTNTENRAATLAVQSIDQAKLPLSSKIAPNSHSTLLLVYSWLTPIQGFRIHYNLFIPGVSTSTCLATILQGHQLKTFIFTPTNQTFAAIPGILDFAHGSIGLAIAGALVWGAMHSLTPGHGKTMVGAYLVGTRATPQHALFLALTTTITHTIGVFALGLVTLFAARYVLPEQIYPWLSLISGLMVVSIGINLFRQRIKQGRDRIPTHSHSHAEQHPHPHSHEPIVHTHHGVHEHHGHSHKPEVGREHSSPIYDSHSQDSHSQDSHSQDSHSQDSHTHAHLHDHKHEHTSHPAHRHDHDHDHDHHHHHLPAKSGDPVTWRSLLALGISGG
ncbi:MAG: ABC transporter permease [Leptolyngbyaceae cyanobacterium CRU_2_3]|nr:ABC transporter permease [Leptolyngbyaceae cyanobacterium CRU_2_3]